MALLDELKKYFSLKDETLSKEEIIQIASTAVSSGKALKITDPTPVVDGVYLPTDIGPYPNGLENKEGYDTRFILSDGVWEVVEKKLPKSDNKIKPWKIEDAPYFGGVNPDQVISDGQIWSVKPEIESTSEKPGTGTDWVQDIDKVSKQSLVYGGTTIDISSYVQNDKRINSSGVLGSYTGAKVAHMVPFSGFNLNILGWQDPGLRNFSFYNETGSPINPQTVNNNYPNGDIIIASNLVRFFSVNLQTVSTQTDPTSTLKIQANVSINTVESLPISASKLSQNNSVPTPTSPTNATNKSYVDSNTFNRSNSAVTGSNNLALKSEIKDRGFYIGVTGSKTLAAGWHTFVHFVVQGQVFSFDGIIGIDALYLSFFQTNSNKVEPTDPYVSGSVIKFNDGINDQPLTITAPVTGYVVIDTWRPGDDKPSNYLNFMFNEGTSVLPYEEPVARTISAIGGYKIATSDIVINIAPSTRLAHFNFWIDDGGSGDPTLKTIFDSKGVKAGWALITNYQGNPLTQDQVDRYLSYQSEGNTIGSHSITHQSFQGTITIPVAEAEMRDSKIALLGLGFDIDFWITPESTMRADLIPFLRKYYKYGFTEYFGSPTPGNLNGGNGYFDEARTLKRVSMEGADSTIENLKLQVDEAIGKGQLVTFYGHTPSAIGTTKLSDLLDYINLKADNLECIVDSPKKVLESYYAVDNEVIHNIYKSLSI